MHMRVCTSYTTLPNTTLQQLREILRVSVTVHNGQSKPINLYWVDDSTDETFLGEIGPGKTMPQNTFIGKLCGVVYWEYVSHRACV